LQETEFNTSRNSEKQKSANEEIKARIEQRITRSMSNKLKERHTTQAIAVINNLIIPSSEKLKLQTIAKKLYQSVKLSQEETSFWNSFSNSEKSYILTGDSAQTLEFTEYQKASFSVKLLPQVEQEEQDWQEPEEYFEPSTSDSDSSEDPDYVPPTPKKNIITTSDDSWPDNSNSQGFLQPSTSKQAREQQEQILDSDSATSSDSEPPQRTLKTHNSKDSWKNTDSKEWKPAKKTLITPDPDSIATRTRSKPIQDVHDQLASHPHDLNIDSMCCDKYGQDRAKPSSGIQKDRALCYKCALSPRENTSQSVQNHRNPNDCSSTHEEICKRCLPTVFDVLHRRQQRERGGQTPSASSCNTD
jgi:hypothetical protein